MKNLKEYIDSDIIDFKLHEGVIDEHQKLFNKTAGLRSYITPYASYLINYTDKKVIMTNIFEESFHEIKAFKLISEHYRFRFEVSLLDFKDASQRDNIIQTIKFHVAMEQILKDSGNSAQYNEVINSERVIDESKRRFEKFITLKECQKFSIEKV